MAAQLALIQDDLGHDEPVVGLRGEIDVASTPALREWIGAASAGSTRPVAVDLAHVEFMAVAGLHALCEEQHRMAPHRARMTIVCDRPRLLGLFDLCRLSDVLTIVPSRADLAASPWSLGDDLRARRLERWLERYARPVP